MVPIFRFVTYINEDNQINFLSVTVYDVCRKCRKPIQRIFFKFNDLLTHTYQLNKGGVGGERRKDKIKILRYKRKFKIAYFGNTMLLFVK